MRTRPGTLWRPRARGATLVEAVAGTFLLGTVLVSILLAKGRLATQVRRAEDALQACQVLDEFLNLWWADRDLLPHDAFGDVPGRDGWRWRTRPAANDDADALDADVIEVAVFPPGASVEAEPAVSVEIVLARTTQAATAPTQPGEAPTTEQGHEPKRGPYSD